MYEAGVGEGIRTCGVPREELFITTKVAAESKNYESAAASIDESLKKAGLSYYDMIIIHHPQPWMEVNQILAHISNTPLDLIEFCQANDILVEAYSPVAHGAVPGNEEIKVIADKYGVSVPQLCLKYDIQLGLVVLPKTANPAHMENNADLDFTIDHEEMDVLKNIEQIRDYGEHKAFGHSFLECSQAFFAL